MPQETTKHREVLAAIESIGAIAELTSQHNGHYDYELDLEVIVYGRNYNGKKVGPYVRLLTYFPGEEIVREGEWGGNLQHAPSCTTQGKKRLPHATRRRYDVCDLSG